ncbi:DUF4279 domain-containing protein [Cupriavidus sp. USMAA2-4]|uniref:DUF4279 domain-containing protein n=1 Tax=Cupriavidus sp. USMAA2-4 TaxID=876364 RepID=UPI000A057F3D|nr:DUF4279 domain-containing protein [Cupriavidus sp. USMAA2-4]
MEISKSLVDVFLLLRGDAIDPDLVTEMLGVAATKSRVKGELWQTSTKHEVAAKIGFWSLDSDAHSSSLSDHISCLRSKLEAARYLPLQIPGVDYAEISIFVAISDRNGGGSYESELTSVDLEWLGRLGVKITVSFNCDSD